MRCYFSHTEYQETAIVNQNNYMHLKYATPLFFYLMLYNNVLFQPWIDLISSTVCQTLLPLTKQNGHNDQLPRQRSVLHLTK